MKGTPLFAFFPFAKGGRDVACSRFRVRRNFGASSNCYTYDAENRLLTTAGVTYAYDGDGNRVKKSSGTLYWGETLAESDLTATASSWKEYIYFAGKRVARREAVDDKAYYYSDHLGSSSVVTDEVGTMSPCPNSPTGYTTIPTGEEESDFYPYGGEMKLCDRKPQNYKFTGKERDTESGLDNFGARYDASALGRFMTTDPMGGHQEDPQTLNRYSYVRNSPTILTDPTGLDSYLACQQGQDNCQQRAVGIDEHNQVKWASVQTEKVDGQTVAIEVKSDDKCNLYDRNSGQSYTGSSNGSGMFFSKDGGKTSSAGIFDNFSGHEDTFRDAGWANGGKLSSFSYTLTNSKLEAGQTEAGFFSSPGNAAQTGLALQLAGFNYHQFGLDVGSDEYRSPGAPLTGANSAHSVVNYLQINPTFGVPTFGQMHFGETNPSTNFFQHVKEWWR